VLPRRCNQPPRPPRARYRRPVSTAEQLVAGSRVSNYRGALELHLLHAARSFRAPTSGELQHIVYALFGMRGCHDEAGVGRAITNDEPVDLVLQLGASWSDDRYQLDAF